MSDLDDELLNMVGGDSDDEGDDSDRLDETQAFGDRSPSHEAQESVEKVEERPASKRGVAQKVKARRRKARKQESEDEGEASPSPVGSIHSDGMPRSEDDADAPGEEEDDVLFPVDGKFHSKSDRDHIMSLPEIEREGILAERAEELEKKRQDAMLKKAFAASSNANKQKRKAGAAELDEGNRRTTRPKTEKRTALDDYKRAREQKGADRSRLDSARDRKDERSPSSASDRDADGESEVEWAEPVSESRRDREEPPAELRDFERCRVGRSNFAKVCFYPKFEESLKGCFARVSIGLNHATGQNQYRMTQIRGFTEGKPYQLENAQGKLFTTDQYAIVAQGSAEKPWPFSACSDGKFTESEFGRFTDTLKKDNMRLPPHKFLRTKLDAIHELLNQHFTEETLHIKFANQRAMEQKHDPVLVARQKRKDIAKRQAEAEQAGDEEEVARCDAELEALDNSGSAVNGAAKTRPLLAKPINQERLALLNHSNRAKNQQEVRQALIAERKKVIQERQAAQDKKTAEMKATVEGKGAATREAKLQKEAMSDLFGETPDGSRAGTPAAGAETPKKTRAGTPQTQVGGKKGPIGALRHRNLDDDVIGNLDLGIDIEI